LRESDTLLTTICESIVADKRTNNSRSSRRNPLTRRTQVVWGIFLGSMTLVCGLLALHDSKGRATAGFLLTSVDVVGDRSPANNDPVFHLKVPLDQKRWTGIVIHHLGEPAGDADSVNRKHLSYGYKGLGYHFLIGNGNGLGDGLVHVGYRWDQQLPGAHVLGDAGTFHNQHSIAICLIGNGDRREFTDSQMTELVSLVQRLQRELHISAKHVYLHRDLAKSTSSPGKFFPSAEFRKQLLP
jgi:hypothetical protein